MQEPQLASTPARPVDGHGPASGRRRPILTTSARCQKFARAGVSSFAKSSSGCPGWPFNLQDPFANFQAGACVYPAVVVAQPMHAPPSPRQPACWRGPVAWSLDPH